MSEAKERWRLFEDETGRNFGQHAGETSLSFESFAERRRRERSIHLEEEPAIVVREPGPAGPLAPQNDQLMSERSSILSLNPALRLKWRGRQPLSAAIQ
jgi:hypothetical protein